MIEMKGSLGFCDAQIFLFDQASVNNKFVDVNPQTMVLYVSLPEFQ